MDVFMTDRATLEALLARVLEGTGPDRELDFAIAAAFGWPDSPNLHQHARRYTESLDATLTLVPPGATWVRRTPSTMALVFGGDDFRMAEVHIEPCRALIAACLRVMMEAQG